MCAVRVVWLLSVLVCCAGTTWWNPREWRTHWQDWLRQRDDRLAQPQQPLLNQPLQKDGINVCEVKVQVSVTQECRAEQGRRRLRCSTKTYYRTDYVCCPGFAREEGKPGCPKELYVSKKNILEVAKSLGLSEFVKLVNVADIGSELILDTKYTAFIPTNEAIQALPAKTTDSLLKDVSKLRDVLLFHIVPKKMVTEAFENNMMLKTMDAPNKLRVNVDKRKKVTVVQGAKVVRANQGASNGVVHVIDRVVLPSSGTLMNYLKGNPQFSILYKILSERNMQLSNGTVFAPSNTALQALPAGRLEKLLSNEQCLQKFLSYHVLSKPMYSQTMTSCRQVTQEGSFVEVKTGADNTSLLVNDVMVTTRDVTTDDGIIHVIDKVLMPFGAMELIEAVKSLKLTTLASLLDKSGLVDTLANTKTPLTLFAPTDKAFSALPPSVQAEISADPEKLKQVLRYHVVGRRVWTYEFGRDTLIDSLEGAKLRLNTFRLGKVHAVNGACLGRSNLETCNNVIHVISHVLIPEARTIYDILRSEPRFSTLVRILQHSSLLPLIINTTASVTLFAPTNKAFERLGKTDASHLLSALENVRAEADQMLRSHMVGRTYFSCSLECKYSYWSLFMRRFAAFSLNNSILRLKTPWNDVMTVNGVRVRTADVTASNGVIHELDKVLPWSPLGSERAWHPRRAPLHRAWQGW